MKKIIYVTALTFFMLTVVEAKDCVHCNIRNGFVRCPPGYSIQKSNGGWYRYVNNVNDHISPCVMFTVEEARELAWMSYATNSGGTRCWIEYERTPTTNLVNTNATLISYDTVYTTTYCKQVSLTDEQIKSLCDSGDICKVKGHWFIDAGPIELRTNRKFIFEDHIRHQPRACKLCGVLEK